jgi:hypothetical protein
MFLHSIKHSPNVSVKLFLSHTVPPYPETQAKMIQEIPKVHSGWTNDIYREFSKALNS